MRLLLQPPTQSPPPPLPDELLLMTPADALIIAALYAGASRRELAAYDSGGSSSSSSLPESLELSGAVCARYLNFAPSGGTQYVLGLPHGIVATELVTAPSVVVEDDGVGLSETDMIHLFKPFAQVNAGALQKGGGTGLGLYLSRRITEAHGGSLTATSPGTGFGAVFTLTLPGRLFQPVTVVAAPATDACEESPLLMGTPQAPTMPTPSSGGSVDRGSTAASSSRRPAATTMARGNEAVAMGGGRDEAMLSGELSASHTSLDSPLTALDSEVPARSRAPRGGDEDWRILHSPQPAGPLSRPPHICIVDDVAANRLMLKRALCRHIPGCVISEAADGAEALRVIGGQLAAARAAAAVISLAKAAEEAALGAAGASVNGGERVSMAQNLPAAARATAPPPAAISTAAAAADSQSTQPHPLPVAHVLCDAVCMDASMPVLDGYEATRRLRGELGYDGVIVGVTGNALAEDQAAFMRAGADKVHLKPVDSRLLVADIRRLLEVAAANAGQGRRPSYVQEPALSDSTTEAVEGGSCAPSPTPGRGDTASGSGLQGAHLGTSIGSSGLAL